jgi:XTP/dITP diphosphohydrolase
VKLVLASGNAGKLRELAALLEPIGYELVAQATLGIESPPETGTTFAENALLKARYAALHARMPALADDSGIEVDALDGRPGVYSARYAGKAATDRQNLEKMLSELQGVPLERRTARYQCVIVLIRDAKDTQPLIATGPWEGRILEAPRGHGGFGYDPIFLPAAGERSAAELDAQEKNKISHRARALHALVSQLKCQP